MLFSELEVSSLGPVHVGLHGLGPFNWAAKTLVITKVQQKMREDSQIFHNKDFEIGFKFANFHNI